VVGGLPREVAILSAVSFTVALGYGIVAPGIPAFARQFGVSVAAAATVISAFALMRVAFAMPAGRLVDRFGSRRVMAAGIAVVAASSRQGVPVRRARSWPRSSGCGDGEGSSSEAG
jgi:MFS family permease